MCKCINISAPPSDNKKEGMDAEIRAEGTVLFLAFFTFLKKNQKNL
jgi:hypothetical protein